MRAPCGKVRTWLVENKLFVAIMPFSLFSLKQCVMKQLLDDSVFVISQIIKVSVSVLTSILITGIPDITKTSSNNCLLSNLEIRNVTGIQVNGFKLSSAQ